MTARATSSDGPPDGRFDRPCPALEPADRWHLDVYGFVCEHPPHPSARRPPTPTPQARPARAMF